MITFQYDFRQRFCGGISAQVLVVLQDEFTAIGEAHVAIMAAYCSVQDWLEIDEFIHGIMQNMPRLNLLCTPSK